MKFNLHGEPTSAQRIFIVLALVAFIFGYFAFQLFKVQVIEHGDYAVAAKQQSTSTKVQQAQRGQILARDRDGKIYTLAASREEYNLRVSPREVNNKPNLARILANLMPNLNEREILEQIDVDRVWINPITRGLSRKQADAIIAENLRGVYVEPQLVRVYPEGSALAAQIIGYVGADGQGKAGVEGYYDRLLRGASGLQTAQQDSFGRLIDILGGSSPEPGKDILLTIDYNLQFFVEKRIKEAVDEFKAESGSAIIMSPKTGAILAMAAYPTYDPNNYSSVPATEHYLFNAPASSLAYEPGSVMKPITMAMAIDKELVSVETEEVFGPSVSVGGFEIKNADNKVFGRQTMTQVLENSDNVAMVWLSQKLGLDPHHSYLAKFGFGSRTGLGLSGESAGILRPRNEWNATLGATASFGHGVSTTLVQIANAYATLANGGRTVQPHIVEGTIEGGEVVPIDREDKSERVVTADTAQRVMGMLESVVVNGHGRRAAIKGVRVGGKTGTAQVPSPRGGYERDKFIGNFAGMFPLDDPEFVMVVRFDNPRTVRFAEASAAPVFGQIGEWIANYYRLR